MLLSVDGWVKRQKQIADPSKSRLREGDRVLACVAGSTRSTLALFSSFGVCYTARFIDIPASTGHGEPIQKLFKMKDGEKIVSAISLDPRVVGNIQEDPKHPDYCPEVHGFAATSNGFALRFGLQQFVEPSTRSGRRYARVASGYEVVGVEAVTGTEKILAISSGTAAQWSAPSKKSTTCLAPGKGVTLIKLSKTDRLVGFKASKGDRDLLTVETNRGAAKNRFDRCYRVTSRGAYRGTEIQKNGKIASVVFQPPAPRSCPKSNAGSGTEIVIRNKHKRSSFKA
ncbi:MAG: DNA gyrase C-terminal beta-propeller domain-containing protein [Pirellulaceae bacterium]